MPKPKESAPVSTTAVAISSWIVEVEQAHREICRELESIRRGPISREQDEAIDQILVSLRNLRSVAPTPRMINTWVCDDQTQPCN